MSIQDYSNEDIITSKCFKRIESNIKVNCLINITATAEINGNITLEFIKFSEYSYFQEYSILI